MINHGAMLQEWALMRFLRGKGYEAEIIDYQPYRNKSTSIPARYNRPLVKLLYQLAKRRSSIFAQKRATSFECFYAKYIKPFTTATLYTDLCQLRQNPPVGDIYIAGSDQIWNTDFNNGNDPAFYLDFGPASTRRLSYAASFATARLNPSSVGFVKRELVNFDEISVRESSGLKILSELGFKGVQVCDPIFLPDIKEYEVMTDSVNIPEKEYIVVYDFENSGEIKSVAKRLARLKGYKIVSVGPWRSSYANYDLALCAPDAFVWLIRNASCVISNSFHGSAFSLLFNKNFFVVERADGLNKRMSDLLSHYGLSNRLISSMVSDEQLCTDIDFEAVNSILHQDIDFSRNWLISNL